jgi:hypothetical protein
MLHPEISTVTWSSQGIRVEYSNSTVACMSAEDIYPLAVTVKPGVACYVREQ